MKSTSPIIQTISTEKSSLQQSSGRYSFLVKKEATKIDVKKAIKELFGVEAKSVQIMITPKKVRILRNRFPWIKRPVMKKAIVTLKSDKKIDPNKIKEAKKT